MTKLKKLTFAAALGFSTLPAMAANNTTPLQSLLASLKTAEINFDNSLGFPTPPLQLGAVLNLPGSGGSSGTNSNTLTLPGLGAIETAYQNQGAGKLLKSSLTYSAP